MGTFRLNRCQVLDNLEIFSSEDENDYFPFHFHDYYCVSLIKKGTELLENTEQQFYAPTGSISITQANEVHRNNAWGGYGYSYQTVYVNPELLLFCNKNKPVEALKRVIDDPVLSGNLSYLFSQNYISAASWIKAFEKLARYSERPFERKASLHSFSLLDEIIEEHPNKPVDTGWLARQFCMSKFHFIRSFKRYKGVTPQTYIMLYRLGMAKKMIMQQIPLSDIACQFGFTDSSHFTRSFKKYYGIPPSHFS